MSDFETITKIETVADLASQLSTTTPILNRIYDKKNSLFSEILINKKKGGTRKVIIIKNDIYRNVLKQIAVILSNYYDTIRPEQVHGFTKGRSILTNASAHTQKKIVVNADIADFFNSITKKVIKKTLGNLGIQKNIADYIAEITTYKNRLATGLCSSPMLSNLACIEMDKSFQDYSKCKKITYTRYADDITLSSDSYRARKKEIAGILKGYNFRMNEDKYLVYRKGGHQYVTGLSVVDLKPRLSKSLKRRLRSDAYYIGKYGIQDHLDHWLRSKSNLNPLSQMTYCGYSLRGFISYIRSIEPNLASYISQQLSKQSDIKILL